jgi:hypothetical protein
VLLGDFLDTLEALPGSIVICRFYLIQRSSFPTLPAVTPFIGARTWLSTFLTSICAILVGLIHHYIGGSADLPLLVEPCLQFTVLKVVFVLNLRHFVVVGIGPGL